MLTDRTLIRSASIKMSFPLLELPADVLVKIFQHCDSGKDMVNLACTCQLLRNVFDDLGRMIKVPVFAEQFGPLDEIIRVVVQPVGQPAHGSEKVYMTQDLIKKVTVVVNVTTAWVNYYCQFTMVDMGLGRFVRVAVDKDKMRLAFYRLWRYYRAFHCMPFDAHVNEQPDAIELRCQLLRQWSRDELLDMQRLSYFIRSCIQAYVCPDTDRMIYRHQALDPHDLFYKFYHYHAPALAPAPQGPGPLIPTATARATLDPYFLSPPPPAFTPRIYYGDPKLEIFLSPSQAWDRIGTDNYQDLLDDVMKLDPGHILWLVRFAPYRRQVLSFLRATNWRWFDFNPETFIETSKMVRAEQRAQN